MNRTTRRTFLRGAGGAALALPLLESLAPAAAAVAPARRAAWFYVPIGVVRRGFFPGEAAAAVPKFSSNRKELTRKELPTGRGPLTLTPTLEPLKRVQDKVTMITGMDRPFQPGTDVHAQCASCFLSSAKPFTIRHSAYPLARTLDHVVADHIAGDTPFRTLEFSANSHLDNKESMYFDNLSWYGTSHVAPSMRDPRKAYRRLFGGGTRSTRNITDLVLADARSMRGRLGRADREKFGEYIESIRSIERQVEKLERMKGTLAKVHLDEPPAARLPRGAYIRLMGDLMIAALQTGLTNVATLMVGPERWDTPFTFEGLFDGKPRSHHQMSHNQGKFIDDLLEVDRFHMEQFAYLVERMGAVEEIDGSSLLDNTVFTYGSGLGDGATHQYNDLPILVAGSGGGQLRLGHHVHLPDRTPLANLWLTQARVMGLPVDRFADSEGMVEDLLT